MDALQGKRIFVVEDNLENRVVYQMIFAAQGATCEFERWGGQTIAKLKAFSPVDLIILDLRLPKGFTGYEIYDQIREIPDLASVPIVAVSASDASVAIPKTRNKGFSSFIAKPIDSTLFPEQLANILMGQSIWYEG
jgi:two-component system, cell cycle response regulator DivK